MGERVTPKSKYSRVALWIIFFIIGFAILEGVNLTIFGNQGHSPAIATSLQTWQQWNMSIQYPAGLETKYYGVNEQTATYDSGYVEWGWNQGNTVLTLWWVTANTFTPSIGFQDIFNNLEKTSENVTVIDQGNITMAGMTWQYQTYQALVQGQMQYFTVAVSFDASNQRGYSIWLSDTYPDTLSAVEYYGNTFNSIKI